MPRRDDSGLDLVLDRRRQLEQPEHVRHRRPLLSHALPHVLLGQPQVVDQAPEGGGLLDRVQVLTLQILDQGQLQDMLGIRFPDEGRDLEQTGDLSRAPAPLAGDQLVLALSDGTHDDRLQDALTLDGGGQLLQGLLGERPARLPLVRLDPVEVQLQEAPALRGRIRILLGRCVLRRPRGRLRDQAPQPPA